MNPLIPLLTAIRDNPDVEINKACDGLILVDVPNPDGGFRILIEGDDGNTEFKVTRVVAVKPDHFTPAAVCWIASNALQEAIAARSIANENAAQDDIIGLVKPVEEVLKGL